MNKQDIYEKIIKYLDKKGAIKIFVFGSYVRGEENPDSDIDIIVDFKESKSLLELIEIEQELTETIGIKVDLLTSKSISPYIYKNIENEMEEIYER